MRQQKKTHSPIVAKGMMADCKASTTPLVASRRLEASSSSRSFSPCSSLISQVRASGITAAREAKRLSPPGSSIVVAPATAEGSLKGAEGRRKGAEGGRGSTQNGGGELFGNRSFQGRRQ